MKRVDLFVFTRSNVVFRKVSSFAAALDVYDLSVVAAINAHILQFERAWIVSKHDGELPSGFHFEAYLKVDDPYRLCQIRVGPKHGYRALVIFLDGSSGAYWIYIFKKVKERQPEDMKRARSLAQRFWDVIERGDENGRR